MKLLVISHTCATPTNQDLFARVQELTGWELTLVLPRMWKTEYGEERVASRLPGFAGTIRPLPVALNGNIPLHFYISSLGRVFRDEQPDVIYVQHDPHGLATMQAFRANRRSVRVPIGFKNDQNLPRRYPWPIRIGERFVYRNAAFALTPAEPPAAALREKGYTGPLRVVPYSVDVARYRRSAPIGNHDRGGAPLVVGYVGRLVPEKGIDTLLEAIARTPEGIRGLIVGTGPQLDALSSLAERLGIAGRIEWRGYVDPSELASVYAQMDMLVLASRTTPSWREQFGRVVIEAISCGVPVCSSDSGEPPRLIEQTGGGWVFPEGDADALAARLRWASAHPDELGRTAEAGRKQVAKMFSAEAVAHSFVDAVRSHAL